MGWLVALACLALLIFIARKTNDRETSRNLKALGKMLLAVFFLAILVVVAFLISK
jgi:hypothetical protein